MKIEIREETIFFVGQLDEAFPTEDAKNAISTMMETHGKCCFDFSKLERANSIGLKSWCTTMRDTKPAGTCVKFPDWFAEQLSIIPILIPKEMVVKSLLLPFYSETTDDVRQIECFVGREVPIQESYDDFELQISVDGETLTLDAEGDILSFIADNIGQYRGLEKVG